MKSGFPEEIFCATVVALAYAGCSSSTSTAVGTTVSDIRDGNDGGADAEDTRIRAYLDRRYTAKDVRHSFKTKFGETIDCIDFFAQRGVKALAARGEPITELPSPPLNAPAPAGSRDVMLHGDPDDNGSPRECPVGSVPMRRITVADIRSVGGLDAFERAHHARALVRGPLAGRGAAAPLATGGGFCTEPFGVDLPDYAHIQQTFNPGNDGTIPPQAGVITSSSAALSLTTVPAVPDNGDHSVAQVWMFSGWGFNIDGCSCTNTPSQWSATTPPCSQTVEVGWMVDTNLFSGNVAVFVVGATSDGYNDFCLDNEGDNCLAFVGYSPPTMIPGTQLAAPTTLTVQVFQAPESSSPGSPLAWWIEANGSFVGYYPLSDFPDYTGAMGAGTGAQTFQAGGEVLDVTGTWGVPMGTGANPVVGSPAAYVDNVQACSSTQCFGSDGILMTRPMNYMYSTAPGAPVSGASNYFYYGNGNNMIPIIQLLLLN